MGYVKKEVSNFRKPVELNNNWNFSITKKHYKGQIRVSGFIPAVFIVNETGFNIHFCPTIYKTSRKCVGTETFEFFNFNSIYENMVNLLGSDKKIREFQISSLDDKKVSFFIRTGMAPVKPDYVEGEYEKNELPLFLNSAFSELSELAEFVRKKT